MPIDLSRVKDANEDTFIGLHTVGRRIYYAFIARTGIQGLGDFEIPLEHPETKEKLKKHDQVIFAFTQFLKMVTDVKIAGICYHADDYELGYHIPILGLVKQVPFMVVTNSMVAASFGFKHKKETIAQLKKAIVPVKPIPEPAYTAIAYATVGVKVRARDLKQEMDAAVGGLWTPEQGSPEAAQPPPATEEKTASGLIIPG